MTGSLFESAGGLNAERNARVSRLPICRRSPLSIGDEPASTSKTTPVNSCLGVALL
jgi:hypothetical protein